MAMESKKDTILVLLHVWYVICIIVTLQEAQHKLRADTKGNCSECLSDGRLQMISHVVLSQRLVSGTDTSRGPDTRNANNLSMQLIIHESSA